MTHFLALANINLLAAAHQLAGGVANARSQRERERVYIAYKCPARKQVGVAERALSSRFSLFASRRLFGAWTSGRRA